MRSKGPGASKIVLGLLCAMYFILFVNRVNISTAAPLIKANLKLSNTELGFAFSAFAFPYAVFQLFGGWVGDRFGPRITLTVCCAVVGVFTALTGLAFGLTSLVLFRLALGFGEGAAFPTATRAMSSWMPEKNWGFAQGVVHSFGRLGTAITPPLIALLIAFTSWRSSFVMLGLATFAWPAVWFRFFRDNPPDGSAGRTGLAGRRHVPALRLMARILPVTVVDFCYGWTLWLFLTWIPSYFFENYHLDLQASAMFSAGVLLAGVVGDTLGGVLSDRLLRKTGSLIVARNYVIAAGFIGAFIFLIPVVLFHNLTIAAVCLSLAFFFAELIVGPIWAIPMDIAPRYAGSASGMMNFGFGVAGIISPLSFGFLIDRTGSWVVPFGASSALLLLGAGLALRLRQDKFAS